MTQNTHSKIPVCLIGGPTASGKSELALQLAQKNDAVIINGDSMQIYADLPILTAQPSLSESKNVPHELYGVLPGAQACSVALWQEKAIAAIERTWKLGKQPIVVGGSGLYLQSLVLGLSEIPAVPEETRTWVRQEYNKIGSKNFHQYLSDIDPIMGQRLHENDKQRIMRAAEVMLATRKSLAHWQKKRNLKAVQHIQCELIMLIPQRSQLHKNSESRLKMMLERGAIDEVKTLKNKNLPQDLPIMKALGVTELSAYLDKNISLQQATALTLLATHQYIKRQSTWFSNQFPQAQFIGSIAEFV